ncbi:Cilia- and flagella-associated protein 20, partial [Linum perenne]
RSKISRDLFCFPAANLSFSERSNHAEPILNNHLKMFKNTFQSGFLSILYSLGSKPLQIWDKEISDGHVKRPHDEDIQSDVLEIIGSKIQSAYITCPADPGIKLSFLVILVKNLKKYFTFEIQVLDDKNVRRRFRASNFQAVTRVKPYICTMPLKLDEGWNQIQFNLADFTKRAYGTNYVETLRVQVHANCRLRRIYFADRLYSEEELPPEFKLYLPMQLFILIAENMKKFSGLCRGGGACGCRGCFISFLTWSLLRLY